MYGPLSVVVAVPEEQLNWPKVPAVEGFPATVTLANGNRVVRLPRKPSGQIPSPVSGYMPPCHPAYLDLVVQGEDAAGLRVNQPDQTPVSPLTLSATRQASAAL